MILKTKDANLTNLPIHLVGLQQVTELYYVHYQNFLARQQYADIRHEVRVDLTTS